METTTTGLKDRWTALTAQQPKIRIRDAAKALDVSELDLLATQLGEGVTMLRPEFDGILKRVPELGKVMALTRNAHVVIEKTGVYNPPEVFGDPPSMGQVVGEDIDLRLFMFRWAHAVAVEKEMGGRTQHSLQFFDAHGLALHKIYLRQNDAIETFHAIVEAFKGEQTAPHVKPEPEEETPELPAGLDREAFLKEWGEMTNTHDFFHLLKRHEVPRHLALQVAEGQYAFPVAADAHRRALQNAAETGLSIMVFAGNPGCLEIHTGPVKKLLEHGDWYNVMDPGFNLHIDERGLSELWVTEKPTDDGIVSSLECYGADGTLLVQFFGERKPGRPELEGWRNIISELKSTRP